MFIELSDEIPYTKINKISLRSVDYLNGTFVINLDRKCENLPEEKNYVINRKMSDLKWVKQKLGVQSPWIVTIPSLAQSSWSFSDVISTSDQQKSRLKLWYNEQYMRKTTERFLHILIDVVLPNIYKNTGFIRTSLFTFFDKNYDIYKTEAYQQSTKKEAQLDISNESTLSMWANSLGKGSMKLLEMLNVWNQQQNHKYLTNCIKEVIELKEGANQLYNELDSIQRSLETLQGNFLNEQKLLKQKEGRVFDYQLKLQDLLRVSTQVLEEMKKVEKKCKQLESKNEDKSYLKQQLGLYEKYILNEVGGLKGQWRKILADLYELNYQREVQMKLGNVYSSKL